MSTGPGAAPPLGQRPSEPRPGKESLEDPRGEAKSGDGKAETCPDCGLPFGEHPEYHMHDGGGGSARWAEVDLGDEDMDADDLPGQRLDSEVGGDPAEA
jgi:hypothetical protein